jgi:hypothetical protein
MPADGIFDAGAPNGWGVGLLYKRFSTPGDLRCRSGEHGGSHRQAQTYRRTVLIDAAAPRHASDPQEGHSRR